MNDWIEERRRLLSERQELIEALGFVRRQIGAMEQAAGQNDAVSQIALSAVVSIRSTLDRLSGFADYGQSEIGSFTQKEKAGGEAS